MPIAEDTSVVQIAKPRGTAVLATDYAVDLMRKTRAILMHQAVFATTACTFNDETARDLAYVMSHWRGSV